MEEKRRPGRPPNRNKTRQTYDAREMTESAIIELICNWLEQQMTEDFVTLAALQRIRNMVERDDYTLAWQCLIPIIEEHHGVSLLPH